MNCNERSKDYLDGYSSQYNFKDENDIEHDLNNDIEEILKQNQELKEKLDCDLQWAFKYERQVDNWNKLKEYIISARYEYGDLDQDLEDYDLTIEDVLDKMQELQGSDSNE